MNFFKRFRRKKTEPPEKTIETMSLREKKERFEILTLSELEIANNMNSECFSRDIQRERDRKKVYW